MKKIMVPFIKILAGIFFICCICATPMCVNVLYKSNAQMPSTYYMKQGTITAIDTVHNIVTFTDFQGNNWNFYGTENWCENDIIAAIMDTQGTDMIYDDVVISVTYQGYATN